MDLGANGVRRQDHLRLGVRQVDAQLGSTANKKLAHRRGAAKKHVVEQASVGVVLSSCYTEYHGVSAWWTCKPASLMMVLTHMRVTGATLPTQMHLLWASRCNITYSLLLARAGRHGVLVTSTSN